MLNLFCNLISHSHSLLVLGVVFLNGHCVDILVVVSLQPKAALVLGEFVPGSCGLRVSSRFQRAIDRCRGIIYPSLKRPLALSFGAGDCGICTEKAGIAYLRSAADTEFVTFLTHHSVPFLHSCPQYLHEHLPNCFVEMPCWRVDTCLCRSTCR
jgi:hypothetical protein